MTIINTITCIPEDNIHIFVADSFVCDCGVLDKEGGRYTIPIVAQIPWWRDYLHKKRAGVMKATSDILVTVLCLVTIFSIIFVISIILNLKVWELLLLLLVVNILRIWGKGLEPEVRE